MIFLELFKAGNSVNVMKNYDPVSPFSFALETSKYGSLNFKLFVSAWIVFYLGYTVNDPVPSPYSISPPISQRPDLILWNIEPLYHKRFRSNSPLHNPKKLFTVFGAYFPKSSKSNHPAFNSLISISI